MFNYRRPRVAFVRQLARRMFYKGPQKINRNIPKTTDKAQEGDQVRPASGSKRASWLFVVFDMLKQTRAFNKETKGCLESERSVVHFTVNSLMGRWERQTKQQLIIA